jgi:branched-chain amino acid transport system permease protein
MMRCAGLISATSDEERREALGEFLHQLASGVTLGGVYAIMALALVMIYQATQLINFAQGEMAMFSTYFAWKLIDLGEPYWLAFSATVVVSFIGGMVIERLVVRPFANAPVLTSVIVFIGLAFIFNSLAGWLYGYSVQSFDSPFTSKPWFGAGYMSAHESGSILVTLAVLALVYAFFRFTPLGLAMRAAAQNPVSSRLLGIRVGWMLAIGWGLAAAIGSIAGMMAAPIVYLDPNMMGGVLLYAFAGAVLGGIDNPFGAAVGGSAVGVLGNLVGAYVVGSEVKLSVALAIIIAVLVWRPSGLFGRRLVARV